MIKNDLNRFLEAQESQYENVFQELANCKKVGHWIWFFFPQVIGLGRTETSKHYSIRSKGEAIEYLGNDKLRKRLETLVELVRNCEKPISEIFPYPDNLKFISSMTLFSAFSENDSIYTKVINEKNNGIFDEKTTSILNNEKWA